MTKSLAESIPGKTPLQWAHDFLVRLGAPVTLDNLQVVYSWEYLESGGGGGMWNPLNTSMPWPGATNYNTSLVKNYLSYNDGLSATIKVIQEKPYRAILSSLIAGDSAENTVTTIVNSIWGTHSLPLKQLPANALGVTEMQFVVSPQKGVPNGRTAQARWNPAYPNQILLINGAKVLGDKSLNTDRRYVFAPVSPGESVVGIAAKGNKGFVVTTDSDDTYDFYWTTP